MVQSIIAVGIFLIVYAALITEKLHRTIIALLGAVLMIAFGIVSVDKAFTEYIEWNTIFLLIGMMILVGIINKTGVIYYIALKAAKFTRGNPLALLILLGLLTAILAAFLDNVTTVLIVVPVTLAITRILKINPIPFFITEILVSNIGGTATLIGDPPNIMIGSAVKHLTFNEFLIHLAPIIAIILVVTIALLAVIYRKSFQKSTDYIQELMIMDEREQLNNRSLLIKSLIVLGFTFLGFILHPFIHIEASVVAIGGATILMLIGLKEREIEEAFDFVEWQSIFFFIGLFILVGGLQEVGLIKYLANQMLAVTGGDIPLTSMIILWGSGIASGFIDNIPFVATMIPLVQNFATASGLSVDSTQINILWWALSLGACLGGNGTLIGASANVIVASLAKKEGKALSYLEFLKIGFPLTLLSLALATVYIYLRYILFLPA